MIKDLENHPKEEGITISELIELIKKNSQIDIEILSNNKDSLDNKIYSVGINRPGLSLTGFIENFVYQRIQILGKEEVAYLNKLENLQDYSNCDGFFSYKVPCCIISYKQEAPKTFLELCEKNNIPILISSLSTSRLVNLMIKLLDGIFAPSIQIHGCLVDVLGIGVLLQGKSGVGKSECALKLIERGHRLVADDLVKIKRVDFDNIQGEAAKIIEYHMEIRGIGIINIQDLFGVSAIRSKISVDIVVSLEEWDNSREYDRLGLDEKTFNILEINLPYLVIPVKPGRDIPIIVETAARNFRLKNMGHNAAKEFNLKLMNLIAK